MSKSAQDQAADLRPTVTPPSQGQPEDDFEPVRTAGHCLDCAHNHLKAAMVNFQEAQQCMDLIDRDGVTTLLSATTTLVEGAHHLAKHQQAKKA